MRKLLADRSAAEVERRQERRAEEVARLAPLPESLRIVIERLGDCMRRSGHGAFRLLRLGAIEDGELRGVEAMEVAADAGGGAQLLVADRVAVALDRPTATLVMAFRDGYRVAGGERTPLPEDGFVLRFEQVDARDFEAHVPAGVIAFRGDYPPPPGDGDRPGRWALDAYSARSWRDRLSGLLAGAETAVRWQVRDLGGLDDEGWFRDVLLLGEARDGNLLQEVIEAERVAVAVDGKLGFVELQVVGGRLRRAGGVVELPSSPPGHRILLSGLEPAAADREMSGMVLRR